MKAYYLFTLIAVVIPLTLQAESFNWSRYERQPDSWFESPQARAIEQNVLSWQTPSGDWPKNIDTGARNKSDSRNKKYSPSELLGTFDNGATLGEIRFLARRARVTRSESCRQAARRGIDIVLKSQYANGGWAQMSNPPKNQYHRYITFNDDAMINILYFLRDIQTQSDFDFLSEKEKQAAAHAFNLGVECILNCQISVRGELTVWCAQHDEKTLEPRPGRKYELASLSGAESAKIVLFLQSLNSTDPRVIKAIQSARRWYEKSRLRVRIENVNGDRVVIEDPNASPMWARFYEIETNKPIFSGRDGIVRYKLSEIPLERRCGYAWYGDWGQKIETKD